VSTVPPSPRELLAADPEVRARLDRWLPVLEQALSELYPRDPVVERVLEVMAAASAARPWRLRDRDRARLLRPDWFQEPSALGYAAYAEQLGGTLAGVAEHVDYLADLGVSYLHLMPLLRPRDAPNDGGYAVADFRAVRADLGTVDDLVALADALHSKGIALTLDLVLNHVAREHEWAQRARAGDPRYRAYFHVFPDRIVPDAYERALPEVFPAFAPGSFTWDEELDGWVWTTFHAWQWDLDWSNPEVFCELLDVVLFLANLGVDCLRLDAIAFLWKRLGTDCQNQPEVHLITEALRAAARVVAPALVFKAEAIVGPREVVSYLGTGRHAGRVSDLAYHNALMVHLWSALATRDVRLLVHALGAFPAKPTTTAWATYLRCHDDIGWAVDDADAAAVGLDGPAHRRFLSDFYSGAFAGTFAAGELFQSNDATGDRRISGTAASLAGLERALAAGDPGAVDQAIGRLLVAHAVVLGFGGLPLLYMGDELGLLNDRAYLQVDEHRDDNRWMHRPAMPWDRAELRHDLTSVEGRVFAGIRRLVVARRTTPALHASVESTLAYGDDPAVLVVARRHAAGDLVQLYNLSERTASVAVDALPGWAVDAWATDGAWERVGRTWWEPVDSRYVLPPLAIAWLGALDEDRPPPTG
jgi:amylosucrase